MNTQEQEALVSIIADITAVGTTGSSMEKYTGDEVRPTPEEIAHRAYQRYVERGRKDGHDIDDWLVAEQELNHHYSAA